MTLEYSILNGLASHKILNGRARCRHWKGRCRGSPQGCRIVRRAHRRAVSTRGVPRPLPAAAVGVPGQRAAPAACRQRRQRREADVEEEVVGVVEAAGQHRVAGAVMEQVAGELHGVERGGAGRIEREGRAFETQGARRKHCRQPRDEAVFRRRRRPAPFANAGEPGVAGEVCEAGAGIGEECQQQGRPRRASRPMPAASSACRPQ